MTIVGYLLSIVTEMVYSSTSSYNHMIVFIIFTDISDNIPSNTI